MSRLKNSSKASVAEVISISISYVGWYFFIAMRTNISMNSDRLRPSLVRTFERYWQVSSYICITSTYLNFGSKRSKSWQNWIISCFAMFGKLLKLAYWRKMSFMSLNFKKINFCSLLSSITSFTTILRRLAPRSLSQASYREWSVSSIHGSKIEFSFKNTRFESLIC